MLKRFQPIQLPVVLPEYTEFDGSGSPLKKDQDFIATTDSLGMPAERDTDTFDTFMESELVLCPLCLRRCQLDAG